MTNRAFWWKQVGWGSAVALALASCFWATGSAQAPATPDWTAVEAETMRHFQAVLRLDTSNPPGNETLVAEYVKTFFDREGIPAKLLSRDPKRANVVARLKGSGRKRPILLMGHTDVVTVDPTKWQHPPFSATREGGYVYGRGALDDKDSVTTGMMILALLKRLNVPLDRDVIFLGESGEEGTTEFGIDYVISDHFAEIDAEYCLAEGGSVLRSGGQVRYAQVDTTEKVPRPIELVARGVSGHGSVPLKSNAVVHLATAVAKLGAWRPEIRLNETTTAYFRRLAALSTGAEARAFLDVLLPDPKVGAAADDWLFENQPVRSSMLRTSVSPNMMVGGYRYNVIPSEATATIDVRMLPDESPERFIAEVRRVIDDPAVEVRYGKVNVRPSGTVTRLDSEGFKAVEAAVSRVYGVTTVPMMLPAATDMAQVRAKGVQCIGVGPAADLEDASKGFAAHSDQERILESELHRFVRFMWDIVTTLAHAN